MKSDRSKADLKQDRTAVVPVKQPKADMTWRQYADKNIPNSWTEKLRRRFYGVLSQFPQMEMVLTALSGYNPSHRLTESR